METVYALRCVNGELQQLCKDSGVRQQLLDSGTVLHHRIYCCIACEWFMVRCDWRGVPNCRSSPCLLRARARAIISYPVRGKHSNLDVAAGHYCKLDAPLCLAHELYRANTTQQNVRHYSNGSGMLGSTPHVRQHSIHHESMHALSWTTWGESRMVKVLAADTVSIPICVYTTTMAMMWWRRACEHCVLTAAGTEPPFKAKAAEQHTAHRSPGITQRQQSNSRFNCNDATLIYPRIHPTYPEPIKVARARFWVRDVEESPKAFFIFQEMRIKIQIASRFKSTLDQLKHDRTSRQRSRPKECRVEQQHSLWNARLPQKHVDNAVENAQIRGDVQCASEAPARPLQPWSKPSRGRQQVKRAWICVL